MRRANIDDLEDIVALWKIERANLGIPWRKNIAILINKGTFFVEYLENQLIGFCAYQVMPRKEEVWILALTVHPDFRRKGYGRALLLHTISSIPSEVLNRFPLYISYVSGAENNQFYSKFKGDWEFVTFNYYKNIVTEVYQIPHQRKVPVRKQLF